MVSVVVVKASVSESLSKIQQTDYFSLFSLPICFGIELSGITEQYRVLQKRFHPDRFVTGSESERLLSLQSAATINDAFSILKSPILRAEYLLSLRGLDIRSEHSTLKDTQFLMQQMLLRERLEELNEIQDPEQELEAMAGEISATSKQLIVQLTSVLDKRWVKGADDAHVQLEAAADLVRKLKFYQKLNLELEQLEEKLLDF